MVSKKTFFFHLLFLRWIFRSCDGMIVFLFVLFAYLNWIEPHEPSKRAYIHAAFMCIVCGFQYSSVRHTDTYNCLVDRLSFSLCLFRRRCTRNRVQITFFPIRNWKWSVYFTARYNNTTPSQRNRARNAIQLSFVLDYVLSSDSPVCYLHLDLIFLTNTDFDQLCVDI